jgi:hypothetical protein
LCASPQAATASPVLRTEPASGLGPDGRVPTGAGAFAAGRWVSVKDRLPEDHCPPLLVTNNMSARNAFGHMSHVWIADMLHEDRDCPGEVCALVGDNLRKIWGVTHWAPIQAESR